MLFEKFHLSILYEKRDYLRISTLSIPEYFGLLYTQMSCIRDTNRKICQGLF